MNSKTSITVGIDEFTVVLMPKKKLDCLEWLDKCKIIIQTFIEKSRLEELYDEMVQTEKGIQKGYTNGLIIENKPWYLCISWHEDFSNMGVCIRFSAYAWASFQTDFEIRFDVKMDIITFIRMLQSDEYITRLSRIDFVADYKNFHLSVNPDDIYRGLKNDSIGIKDYKNRNMIRSKTALDIDGLYSTIYLGSRKSNTRCFSRIYNKRLEILQTKNFRYEEAINCKRWIRQEVVFKNIYAHQITSELLKNINTPYELQAFIAQKITEKYSFYDKDTNQFMKYTRALLAIVGNNQFNFLRSEKPKDNDLKRSINYLINGSGLFSTLFKSLSVWGDGADVELLIYLFEEYQNYYIEEAQNNKEILTWLRKHASTLRQYKLQEYF
ncbi:replication initiation factor domain-containing protein [Acetobacterium tundrae]|uniref:Replication initiation protein-like C-terminal domain-containing protein n=1 Tax=Acetobacterium tundrae TaxID=132932 RepID=A0ABR6WIX3_9FIRM|nr:replication initiation factor domain-containing protein [Acetobacterium tundrae]MBC3796411.1 hypothetical protein [Acetobacterium tundrae]